MHVGAILYVYDNQKRINETCGHQFVVCSLRLVLKNRRWDLKSIYSSGNQIPFLLHAIQGHFSVIHNTGVAVTLARFHETFNSQKNFDMNLNTWIVYFILCIFMFALRVVRCDRELEENDKTRII